MFQRGDEILSGWRVRFVAGAAAGTATQNYRVRHEDGARAFLKVLGGGRTGADALGADGRLREISILQSLTHPGVPRVLETGTLGTDGRPYVLMELVPGETLEALLARNIAVSPAHARELTLALLETVAHLHQRADPVFHNRLTPAHVVLDVGKEAAGRPVVVGFGGARRSSDGAAPAAPSGDPRYLPNECLDAPVLSPAVDVFSLGAIWFHLLCGHPPWDGGAERPRGGRTDSRALAARRKEGPPPLPAMQLYGEVPDADLKLILKALAFDPGERFEDAGAFRNAVAGVGGDAVAATLPPAVAGAARPERQGDGAALSGLERIAGMERLKATLIADVVKPLRDPERYRRFGVGIANGVLLYGPPGCGKTFFAECLGQEIGFAFEAIRPSDIGSTYVHGSQLKIAELFKRARKQAPCVLFVDEVDALIPTREAGLHSHRASEVNEWLTQLNRAADAGVFVVAATNRPDRLDPAALRTGRLDKTFFVEPPDREAREAMFRLYLRNRPLEGDVDSGRLADRTGGWMASDIRFLVDEAARSALAADATGISEAHLLAAIQRNPPSVSQNEIARYQAAHDQFDRGGKKSAEHPGRRIGFSPPPGDSSK